jgi:nitroreductase
MDAWDAIRTKRMVRRFEARAIEADRIERIVDAGRHAGSSKNLQRWDFIVVTDRSRLERLAAVGRYAGHLAGAASAVALVTPDPSVDRQPRSVMWDLGLAAQNMMLAAWELGIGSVPATVYEHDRTRELLGYPADRHCEYLISFGYPADPDILTRPNKAGGRQALTDIVHDERW